MILFIDNYDSFVYNLYQAAAQVDPDIRVVRNDEITVEEALALSPDSIILSPGPGRPEQAGICIDLIRAAKGRIPILGICLGHQAIACAFGATVGHAKELMHGKTSFLTDVKEDLIFHGISAPIQVARYHSLSIEEGSLPEELYVTARTEDGEIMAVSHKGYPIYGLQFHPESVMTPEGFTMIKNFITHFQK